MRARALAYAVVGCAAALAATWQIGRVESGGPAPGSASAAGSSASETPSGGATPSTGRSTPATAGASAPATHGSSGPSRTFAGSTAQTRYGPVQVAIVVKGGRIADVKALQLTNDGGRSVAISAAAAPILRTEALKAQSAKVDTVSGATYTSDGYRTSLQAAIDKAGL